MFTSMSAYYTPACRISSQQAGHFSFTRLLHTSTLLLAMMAAWTAQPAVAEPPHEWAEGRILVQPRAGLEDGEFDKIIKSHGAKRARKLEQINLHIVDVPPAAEEAVAKALSNNPHIKFAELDMKVAPAAVTPNDPYYSSAWHLTKIQAPAAWDSSMGQGITVAVLDSGVDPPHPDLVNQLVPGWNFYDNNADTTDVNNHGTWVLPPISLLPTLESQTVERISGAERNAPYEGQQLVGCRESTGLSSIGVSRLSEMTVGVRNEPQHFPVGG